MEKEREGRKLESRRRENTENGEKERSKRTRCRENKEKGERERTMKKERDREQ